jgi:hypothetical protein
MPFEFRDNLKVQQDPKDSTNRLQNETILAEDSHMKQVRNDGLMSVALAAVSLTIITAFQNCAVSLPQEGIVGDDQASKRPTPSTLISPTPLPTPDDSGWGNVEWEGICESNPAVDPMIAYGPDGPGALIVFQKSDGSAALWNTNSAMLYRGVLCRMTTPNWSIKAQGDFNGDGTTDLIWKNTDGRMAIWLMQGASRIRGGLLPNQSNSALQVIGTGDFNGDGKADLLWGNSSTRAMKIWQMNAENPPVVLDVNQLKTSGWTLQGIADFTADGKADILWRNTEGALILWQMNGPIVQKSGMPKIVDNNNQSYHLHLNWKIKAVGDFDGDGMADLYWFNSSDRKAQFWKMSGFGDSTPAIYTALDPAYTDIVHAADADLDGRTDIFLTYSYANKPNALTVWKVVNASTNAIASSQTLRDIGAGWTIFRYPSF